MVVESLRGTELTGKTLTRHVCLLIAEPLLLLNISTASI